jgi:hypothetical protein
MNKLLWLIVVALALIVIAGCAGLRVHGSGGSHVGSVFPANGTNPHNTLTKQSNITANRTANGQNVSADAAKENLERMQIQGIAPPCEDIQRNCDVPGPVPAETYTQAELIGANTVPAKTAEQIAKIASAGACSSNVSGGEYQDVSLTSEPVTFYDVNGMKLYYRFSAGIGNGTCIIFVKANKLLGSPLFVVRSDPDCIISLEPQSATAEKTVLADYPGFRVVSYQVVFYRDNHEGIQYVMVNQVTGAHVQPVLDLCTYADVTQNATSLYPLPSDAEYISNFGEYERQISNWEAENVTLREPVNR